MKLTKIAVKYEHPAQGPHHCSQCVHFQVEAPKHCEIVEGIIQPEDWCKKFEEKQMSEHKKKHAGHGVKSTHITHHHDGSHTMEHHMEDGSSHAAGVTDLDGVHDKLEASMGQPNPGEAAPAAPAAPMAPGAGAPPMGM